VAHINSKISLKSFFPLLLDDFAKLLDLNRNGNRRLQQRVSSTKSGQLEVGFLHYIEEKPASWTTSTTLVDRQNQLVLICRRNRHLVVCLSDQRWRHAITRNFNKLAYRGLGNLESIEPGILNAAFAKGRARTLWLTGTHRPTSVKADSKVLTGLELQDALDPLADQSYFFTAARCETSLNNGNMTVGLAPRSSRIWAGLTKDWIDLRQTIADLLDHLEGTKNPQLAPMPILALPNVNTADIEEPFDAALLPPELFADDALIAGEELQTLEEFAYDSYFAVQRTNGLDFNANFYLKGSLLGTVEFTFDTTDPSQIDYKVKGDSASDELEEKHSKLLAICRRKAALKVWFESGHTLSDGVFYQERFRDIPFSSFSWADFSLYDVIKEKPEPINVQTVGRDDSLFSWVKNAWPNPPGNRGWLACDDGSGEMADFVHLDDARPDPVLSLIHVKAAGNPSVDREISVAKYEVVVSQAIKNLRHLDRVLLEEGLQHGLGHKVSELVWRNGRLSTRERMIRALSGLARNPSRRVVIVQPHMRNPRWRNAMQNPNTAEGKRLLQLNSLLHSAAASCRGLSAELFVIGAD
jgi:hypothetical protein